MADYTIYKPVAPSNKATFSGSDVDMYILTYGKSAKDSLVHIDNLGVISYSVHRDKAPVRALGKVKALGYTKGARTVAGSIVLTNFDRAAFYELLYVAEYGESSIYGEELVKSLNYTDEIPAFDIMLLFTEERSEGFGNNPAGGLQIVSKMLIKGVELIDEGALTGTEEAYMETTMQYVASGIEKLEPIRINEEFSQTKKESNLISSVIKQASPYEVGSSHTGLGYVLSAMLSGSRVAVDLTTGRVLNAETPLISAQWDNLSEWRCDVYRTGYSTVSIGIDPSLQRYLLPTVKYLYYFYNLHNCCIKYKKQGSYSYSFASIASSIRSKEEIPNDGNYNYLWID